jgi:hypothetical protein
LTPPAIFIQYAQASNQVIRSPILSTRRNYIFSNQAEQFLPTIQMLSHEMYFGKFFMFLFSYPFLPYFGSSGIRPFSMLHFPTASAHTCLLLFRLSINVRFFDRIGISKSWEAQGWWLMHLDFLFFALSAN